MLGAGRATLTFPPSSAAKIRGRKMGRDRMTERELGRPGEAVNAGRSP